MNADNKQAEKVVMYDSPEAAQQITLTGWVSGGDNKFWYKDEHMARWSGCTHLKCDCGNIMKKGWTKCDVCRAKLATERYLKLPFREWDGIVPIVERGGDKYFFEEEELIEYMEENEMQEIDLLFCEENEWMLIPYDYWDDIMPEDMELPKKVEEALDAFNKILKELPPCSYSPSKIRTHYKLKNEAS